jgi:hypothetical protein
MVTTAPIGKPLGDVSLESGWSLSVSAAFVTATVAWGIYPINSM